MTSTNQPSVRYLDQFDKYTGENAYNIEPIPKATKRAVLPLSNRSMEKSFEGIAAVGEA
jgi:hypothetical protein